MNFSMFLWKSWTPETQKLIFSKQRECLFSHPSETSSAGICFLNSRANCFHPTASFYPPRNKKVTFQDKYLGLSIVFSGNSFWNFKRDETQDTQTFVNCKSWELGLFGSLRYLLQSVRGRHFWGDSLRKGER